MYSILLLWFDYNINMFLFLSSVLACLPVRHLGTRCFMNKFIAPIIICVSGWLWVWQHTTAPIWPRRILSFIFSPPPSKICHHSLLTTCTQSLIVLCNGESCERPRGKRIKKKNKAHACCAVNRAADPLFRTGPCDIRWHRRKSRSHNDMRSTKASLLSNDRRSPALRAGVYIRLLSRVYTGGGIWRPAGLQNKTRWMESRGGEKGDKETRMEKEGAA